MKYILLSLLLLVACTNKKNSLKNQVQNGHEELYSEPEAPKEVTLEEGVERIVIASTNDLQGQLSPLTLDYNMKVGGADILGQYLKVLRSVYGDLVLVDSGNFLPSKSNELQAVHDFYQSQKYDAVAVGLNDFNLKIPKKMSSNLDLFKEFTKTSNPPLVLSNLFQLKTGRTVEWEGSKPYVIKEIRGIKIGIIGLVAQDIVNKTPIHNRTGLFVEEMVQSTLRHARLLRSLGTDVIVVMVHEGVNCGEGLAETSKLPVSKVNFEPKAENVCNLNSEMGSFLKRLPPNLIDVVIGGRVQNKTMNYVNDTLVISGFHKGQSLNYVELFVDKTSHKVLPEMTEVHQPVMTCHEFFKKTTDCYTEDPTVDHATKIPAKFLGQEITPDVEAKTTKNSTQENRDIQKFLKIIDAQIAFTPHTTGNTQLVVIELSGNDLLKILEEEYNRSNTNDWTPSPFEMKEDGLHLKINGEVLSLQKSYRVLADMEAIINSSYFNTAISTGKVTAYPTYSWNEAEIEEDSVQTALAAPEKSN